MTKKKVAANINDAQRVVKCKEFLEYRFSEDEIKDYSNTLARVTQEKIALENEKKAITSEFKAKIDTKVAEAETLARKITNKSEHRYIDCELHMNTPVAAKKRLVRKDTGEIVWEKPMTAEEMQLQLYPDVEDAAATATVQHSKADDNNTEDF